MQKTVLIIADSASEKFGGEAILPLHYFRELRKLDYNCWMLVHERTKTELDATFPSDSHRIYYVRDRKIHRILQRVRRTLPTKIGDFSIGTLMKFLTQILQRRMAKKIIRQHRIDLIHQPTPVSPKTPSFIFGLGIPVIIGPMNGGMQMPAGYSERIDGKFYTKLFMKIGRGVSEIANVVVPGKYFAETLLVANERTRSSLPFLHSKNVYQLVENGVDPNLFEAIQENSDEENIRICYMGRLVNWKGVDILLKSFARFNNCNLSLHIIGGGVEKKQLQSLSKQLGIDKKVTFYGFKPQHECAILLNKMSFMVLPSLYECGGAVVLEAMSKGLPVIASNWGGPADYLDSNTGLLVDPQGGEKLFLEKLTLAIDTYIAKPELRKTHAKNAKSRVMKYFSWEKKAREIIRIYENTRTASPIQKQEHVPTR